MKLAKTLQCGNIFTNDTVIILINTLFIMASQYLARKAYQGKHSSLLQVMTLLLTLINVTLHIIFLSTVISKVICE